VSYNGFLLHLNSDPTLTSTYPPGITGHSGETHLLTPHG
jgi:hypothetical protein